MPKPRRITSVFLQSLKPGRDNGEVVIESDQRGEGALVLRVTDFGKPIYYRYSVEGKHRFELVGYFDPGGAKFWIDPTRSRAGTKGGQLTLSAAKQGFVFLTRLARSVVDLKAYFQGEAEIAEAERRDVAPEDRVGSFQALLDSYVADLKRAESPNVNEVESILKRNVSRPFPEMMKTRARDVTPEQIQEILTSILKRSTRRQADITCSHLRAAFQHVGKEQDHDPRRAAADGAAFGIRENPVELVLRIAEFNRT